MWKEIAALRKEYGLTEYAFHKDVVPMQHHFKTLIDSACAQKIASSVYRAYEKKFFGSGKEIHHKKYGQLESLEGKSNHAGIRYKDGTVFWLGLEIPAVIDPKDTFLAEALAEGQICYCRIRKLCGKSRDFYVLQLVMKGNPPVKKRPDGSRVHERAEGDVGIDIGTSTAAVCGEHCVLLTELSPGSFQKEQEKAALLQQMDQSRRKTNPDRYEADGTIKAAGGKKKRWKKSGRYLRLERRLRVLNRKQAAQRKQSHEALANEILAMGDRLYIETMRFSDLAKRAEETIASEGGRCQSKKRFGKSIGHRAPAMLVNILARKLSYEEKTLRKVDTMALRASQYHHTDQTFRKKALSERWNDLDGDKVQRDLYSAFLLQNVNDDLKTYNQEKLERRYETFLALHEQEILRLSQMKTPACMGL